MIPRSLTCVVVAVGLVVGTAAHAEDISIQWDDCPPAGTTQKMFACDTNQGDPFSLILSIVPPERLLDVVGFTAIVDLDFQINEVPPWWDFPGCRLASDLHVTQATGQSSCPDMFENPFFLTSIYQLGHGYPYRSRLRVSGAIALEEARPLEADTRVSLCRIAISRRSTVGTSACAGCLVPACVSIRSVLLERPPPGDARYLYSGSNNFVRWQAAKNCPLVASPVGSRTWGQIKALYR